MKLFRWKYVVPRLILLLAVAAALRFGLDPTIRWAIVASGESAIGAKVELAEVKTSLRNGEVVFSNLAIANPSSPLRNLLQTEEAKLQIDINALLHKRFVVNDGTVKGIEFDTDRTTSGKLAETPDDANEGPSVFDPWLNSAGQFGEQWLDQLNGRLGQGLVDQLESPKVAKELEQRWPQQYKEIRAQIDSLREQSKSLEKQFREVRKNPLRNLQGLGQLQQQLATADAQLRSLQQQLTALPQQIEADRQAVLLARQRDEAFIRSQLQFTKIDGDSITQMLLGDATSQGLTAALDWIGWARRQIPSKRNTLPASRGRGTTVIFGQAKPQFWIKRLQLEGQAQTGGQPIHLVGSLTNATSAPQLVAEPTKLSLRSDEGRMLAIDLTLDRRGETAIDHLQIACPQITLPGRTIGNAEKLAIQIAPSSATFHLDLTVTGNQLAGQIVFKQTEAQLSATSDSQKNKRLIATLGQALDQIKQVEANVTLAGTLQKPGISLQSDLGNQLAAGINNSVKQLLEKQSQALLASTRKKVDAQLERLAQARQQAQQELLAKLGKHQELLGQLAALGQGGSPISIPQLGKTFRFGTQRK
ncbi:MAG: TIGR03545 family protein [Planctomycetes bacterium]|nr:TIGR03545 family protein [Planctomycetota bacterium]